MADDPSGELHVAARLIGDWRFPELSNPTGDEIGFYAPADVTSWDRSALRASLTAAVSGIEPRQVEDRHREIEAGASYESLELLAQAASFAGVSLAGTIQLVKASLRRSEAKRIHEAVSSFTPENYQETAIQSVCDRYDLRRDQLTVDSVAVSTDGTGAVELSIPDRSARYVVDVELHLDGLRHYRMTKINKA